MKYIFFSIALCGLMFVSCNSHTHENESGHDHDDAKLQLTAYGNEWEVYAEADPFATGQASDVLAHFSLLENFKPLAQGSVTATLTINGNSVSQTLEQPTRLGICKFTLAPETEGVGTLVFTLNTDNGKSEVTVPNIKVFADRHDAEHAAEDALIASSNAVTFTKEQSWKINFATAQVDFGNFGQVIKTAARVQSATSDETVIVAKTSGTILFSGDNIALGTAVATGQKLFYIASGGFADNDLSVKYAEAKNNYDKAKADYDRAAELAQNKIVSEKDLQMAKTDYDNAKAVYDNLQRNFSSDGQSVTSTMSGFVKSLNVQSGQFVEAGQTLATISKNKNLFLIANISPKYIAALSNVHTANIRTTDGKTFSLEELNGKLVSYGKSAEGDNFLIPVTFQIENRENFVSGGFVDLFIKTLSNAKTISLPNEALTEEMGNYFVYVQLTPELFEKREVTIGATDGKSTEIKSGLSSDERIVTKGAILVKLVSASGSVDAHSGHVH
ncbi:MAG: efflux RND transporter periplasmic adaptor subunit [Tannerella sp.]|jgi:RND family efflux transporter MFP subunit|nr:efflux RND transporter periplasmic adaptor subunit [Tannerella sp.]